MSTWETSVYAKPERCESVETILEAGLSEILLALTRFEDGANWRVTALTSSELNYDLLSRIDRALQHDEPVTATIKVPEEDWVAKVQRDMPPILAGRYWVHGSHVAGPGPLGTIPILVDAASAFGTGHHESTKGCLLMLDRLGRHLRPRCVLDIGTGTGILAIASAKTWRVPVLASDFDPVAICVARNVVRQNGVDQWVHCTVAIGATGRAASERGPFELITANILAGPLASLAPSIARHAAPGAHIVLSGILASQTAQVVAAYRFAGLHRTHSITLGQWITLGFRRI